MLYQVDTKADQNIGRKISPKLVFLNKLSWLATDEEGKGEKGKKGKVGWICNRFRAKDKEI